MKNRTRLAISAAVILILLTLAAMAGLHYAARELKAQVQEALGPDSEVGDTTVRLTSIEIRDVRVKAPKGWPTEDALRAKRIVVVPDLTDLISAKVRIDRITAEDVYLSVWRSRDGRMRLLPSMLDKPGAKKADAESTTPIIIGEIELKDGVLELFDSTVRQPAHKVRLEQLQATVKDINLPSLSGRTKIELDGVIKGVHRNGTLAIDGWAELSEKNSEIVTKLRDVDLIALQPYLIKASETGVRRGTMNFDLKSTVRKNRLHAPGTLTLIGLELAPGGAFGTFMGVPRQAVVSSLKDRNGQIVVKFTLEGNLDNPQFSLNENLALRLGTSVAGVLGISVGNLAKGVGINTEGLGGAVKKYSGIERHVPQHNVRRRAAIHMILSDQQLAQFRTDGYLLLKNLATREACNEMLGIAREHLQASIAPLEYEADVGYPGAPASIDAPGGRTVRRLRSAYERAPCFQRWARAPELVAKLAQIFGEEICLSLAHHNCVMTKHPDFGSATGWHRDIRYWSFARPDLISVWLALGTETADNGGLKFIPGSHRMQIERAQLDDLDFLRPDAPANQPLFAQGIQLELQQGDVVFFHSGLFHAAGKNSTTSMKASVVLAYHAKSNRPTPGSKSALAGEVLLGV